MERTGPASQPQRLSSSVSNALPIFKDKSAGVDKYKGSTLSQQLETGQRESTPVEKEMERRVDRYASGRDTYARDTPHDGKESSSSLDWKRRERSSALSRRPHEYSSSGTPPKVDPGKPVRQITSEAEAETTEWWKRKELSSLFFLDWQSGLKQITLTLEAQQNLKVTSPNFKLGDVTVQLERGLVFVRDVTRFFEKADGERRSCPRCSGSGLLKPRRIWHWNSRSVGNESCWFCEGVGVMPLFGLNGFILGRATAAVNTGKHRELVNPPIQIHLCLGKYPGSKTRFNSYSPTQNMPSLLYEPGNVPVWVADAVEELALQVIEDSKMEGAEVGKD